MGKSNEGEGLRAERKARVEAVAGQKAVAKTGASQKAAAKSGANQRTAAKPARQSQLTWREYAEFAKQPPERVYQDCKVDVFRATGPGGQGVNTTDSAVRMRHVPTGVTVVSRESRSQAQNRQTCLAKLHDVFARRAKPPRPRKKTRPTKASKERRLKAKRIQGERKALRSRRNFE